VKKVRTVVLLLAGGKKDWWNHAKMKMFENTKGKGAGLGLKRRRMKEAGIRIDRDLEISS